MNRTARALIALVCLPAAAAFAQPTAAASRDKEAVTFDEVERGFYFGVSGGPTFMLNAPAAAGTPRPFSVGQMIEVEAGVDLGDIVSIGAFVLGSAHRADSRYIGFSDGAASGDFSALVPGAVARVSFLGFRDANEVRRTWLYIRAGAGAAFFSPKILIPDIDAMVFAGPGVEYYTRLRHFSIGLEVTGTYLVKAATMGFSVTPNLRYAF